MALERLPKSGYATPMHGLHWECLTPECFVALCDVCLLCRLDGYTQEDVG